MATFTFFDSFKQELGEGTIDLNNDTFRIALSDTAPSVANDETFSDITEISSGNGYAAGGGTLQNVTWQETSGGSGIWRFSADDFTFTASGGSIGPFRYIIIYSDTPLSPGNPLVGYLDNGSSLTLQDGNQFTVDITPADGLFQLDG